MSTYDDASLVMIPSGYKTGTVFSQKPMSTDGQLAFTRSNDTATRVDENGLIEKVRTNLLVQSNTFSNAAWTKTRSSIVADSVANPIDGTVNASTLLDTTDNNTHLTFQTLTATANPYTFSVYAKATGVNWIQMRFDNGSALQFVYFDLSTGSIGSATAASGKITSVGNGWYRCSITATATAASFFSVVHLAEANNDNSFAGTGTNGVYLYAAQTELGDIATDPILTTTAAVSVGPVANIPRIDYLGGGCGKLLLEPQRTNLALFSEQFDNAAWTKTRASVTANAAISPDGYQNADKLIASVDNNTHILQQSSIPVTAQIYTATVFAKKAEYDTIRLFLANLWSPNPNAVFNLTSKEVVSSASCTAKITELSNDWFRCEITATVNAVAGSNGQFLIYVGNNGNVSLAGDGTSGIFIYGAQLEAGSYASSYVNTLAASVTRGADFAEKTSISSLVGGSEGTFFLELDYKPISSSTNAQIYVGSLSNIIGLASSGTNTLRVRINAVNDIIGSVNPSVRHKIAISFNASGVVCYVNGSSIALPNGASQVVSGLDTIGLNPSTRYNDLDIYQMLYFKTRLPNSELAALTTL